MLLFALTIFLSAFLLFQVQPLVGRYVLPWFGGAPATWTTCLLFFQVALLAGYAWADLLQRVAPRRQAIAQILLLTAAAAMLPVAPSAELRPAGGEDPTWNLLLLLAGAVGLPYVALSSTGPLVQAWFARVRPGESAYRLYALSNAGSLLGLATYPVLVEPELRLASQAFAWSGAFVAYAALCVGCAVVAFRAGGDPARATAGDRARPGRLALWLALPFATSALLLSATQQICQDVASVPFLWVLPLGLYLLSFIVAFGWTRPPPRAALAALLVPSLGLALHALWVPEASMGVQVAGHSALLFALCLAAHVELVRTRPQARGPTGFYLAVAAGSSAGASFVAIAAPRIFPDLWEYHLSILLGTALVAAIGIREAYASRSRRARLAAAASALTIGLLAAVLLVEATRRSAVATARNFYGVLRVRDEGGPPGPRRTLLSGRTLHGIQFLAEDRRDHATSYYGPGTGIFEAIRLHPRRVRGEPLRIGVVGLGVGTIAAHLESGDSLEFYEINPAVATIARERFTFLGGAAARGASVEIHLGDARLVLEEQLDRGEPRGFDVLAIDAFTSDAIPVHLLTLECALVYRAHLAEGGTLAFHASNRHVDLAPIVRGLADALDPMVACLVSTRSDPDRAAIASDWILLTTNVSFRAALSASGADVGALGRSAILWTDDFSSLWPILRER